jgi:EmrB/QacA subfamily drug resistance transporter
MTQVKTRPLTNSSSPGDLGCDWRDGGKVAALPLTSSSSPLDSRDRRWIILAILGISQLMVVLDATIVNVALPAIQKDLAFSASSLQWVVNGYTLAFGGFLLLGGRLADRLGRRRVFMIGAALFAVSSLLGGIAQTQGLLVASRSLQGIGGALMSPAALSLLTVIFREGEDRDRALGVWAGITAGGAALGLILGGVLTEYTSWRWVLFVNVPIAVGAVLSARVFVPESRDETAAGFDLRGAVTGTGGLVALVYALVRGNHVGWASTQTIGTIGLAVVLLGIFLVIQRTAGSPLVPGRLFKGSSAAGADISALLVGAAIFAIFFFLSIYLQGMKGYSPIKTGLAFLPMTLIIGVGAAVASSLLGKVGPRPFLAGGMASSSAGLFFLTRITPDSTYLGLILPALSLVALGLGLTFVSMTSSAVAGIPEDDAGIASAMLSAGQQIGGALGLAILTAVSTARFDHVAPILGGKPTIGQVAAIQHATTSGYAYAFAVGAAILLVGAILAMFTINVSKEDAVLAGM